MDREELIATVTAAQNGDSEALNKLFNTFYNDVYYFALKNVKEEDLACDITQETFVEIIGSLGDLAEPVAFVTWMKKITYHQCTRYFKKKKDVLVDEDEDGNTVFDTLAEERAEFIPDEALDQEDFRKTIMAMVDALSDEQRAAVMMFYFDELPVKQIAEMQGVSEGTVKSRLNYARKSIKASVEEYEKKNNVKLHSFAFLPLLVWLFRGYFGKTMSVLAAQNVASGVSAATGTVIAVSAGSGATAVAATTATASVLAKIVAGIAAAAVLVGGGLALANSTPSQEEVPAATSTEETTLSGEPAEESQLDSSQQLTVLTELNFTPITDYNLADIYSLCPYPAMRYFASASELSADEAARFVYPLWAEQQESGQVRYTAISAEAFQQLCRNTLGWVYDVNQLTGQYAVYDPALDAVVMTCGTPFVDYLQSHTPVYERDDGFFFVYWANDGSVLTVTLETAFGAVVVEGIREGDLRDEFTTAQSNNATESASIGNLRLDGYYVGLGKYGDGSDSYVSFRFYPEGDVVFMYSTNYPSPLGSNDFCRERADAYADKGYYLGKYELNDGQYIKGESMLEGRLEGREYPYIGCISGTVNEDGMHLLFYYTHTETVEVEMEFIPFPNYRPA